MEHCPEHSAHERAIEQHDHRLDTHGKSLDTLSETLAALREIERQNQERIDRSVPRTRGDDPACGCHAMLHKGCSPHTRG